MIRILAALAVSFVFVPAASAELALYRSGEVLVKYRVSAGSVAAATLKRAQGFEPQQVLLDGRMELLRLPSVIDVPAAVRMLNADPAVEYAEPNFLRYKLTVTPNDPLFPQQWGLTNTGQANFFAGGPAGIPGGDLHLTEAWDLDNNGTPDHTGTGAVTIAIVDDAVDTTHPDLAPNLVAGFNFVDNNNDVNPVPTPTDPQNHGTLVSGAAAAAGNNGIGVAGAAWNEKLMPLKFGFVTSTEVLAFQYARDHGARIVNASFGGPSYSRAEFDAISNLNDNGILLVTAAGNEDSNIDFSGASFPANYQLPNVVAVAATNRQDGIASFSSYGSVTVPVAAPGLQIVTTCTGSEPPCSAPSGGYTNPPGVSGTSFSSPYVAGIAALIRDYLPAATPLEIKARLIESADPGLDPTGPANLRSAGGRVNAATALRMQPRPSLVIQPVQNGSYPLGDSNVPIYVPVIVADNGNGALDPGETANVHVTIENLWLPAVNVRGSLSATGGVTVAGGTANFGNLGSGATAAADFSVTVPAGLTGHQYIGFTLALTADGGYTASRHFIQEVGRLQNGVAVNQTIQTSLYDEFHTYHFDTGPLASGSNRLTFTTTAANNVDLIVSFNAPPQYNIALAPPPVTGQERAPFYFVNVPDAQIAKTSSGNETVTIDNPQSGTYFVTVVNFDRQQNAAYSLSASLNNTPPAPPPSGGSGGGGGALPPIVLLGMALAACRRRRR